MQMYYKINFVLTNEYYINIINEQIKQDNINIQIKKYDKFFILDINDEEEKITTFFQNLEKSLPLSIYLKDAQFIQELDKDKEEIEFDNLKQNVSLPNNKIIELINADLSVYDELIQKLNKKETIEFETSNGIKKFALPNKENRELLEKENEVNLFIANTNNLTSLVEISTKDMHNLCSIERPLVKLKFNFLQNKEQQYSAISFINAKLPDDEQTFKFALALKNKGIDFLIYSDFDVKQKDIKVSYFKDENIVISGDKAIFPTYDIQDKKVYNSSKELYDENGGVLKTIIKKENKRTENSLGVYFSYNSSESKISLNTPTKGLKDIIYIPNIENSISSCMEDIASMDENTARLVDNYKNKFPQYFEKELPSNTNGFVSILNFVAVMLGMKDYKEFESYALSANLKSGLQVDMKIEKLNGKNFLDYRKIAHSIFSYKIADVENSLLAYSFYESLSEFLKTVVEEVNSDIKVRNIIFCGNMFSNSILLQKAEKELSREFNPILSKKYTLDY
ncbi:hypothetical protein CRU98_04085 [Arcobacter sp. CECT 8986]|uniref:Kae1-like domain-containing protein n=1 Tax=Arcobacter sp. CECT 8986 TaxID=2044507 RepID=UPI001009CD2D|nr:hypothetical protein [Arcobacter sp. CECT 8986]RXK00345.1 hypothetical protein CRU98_04085 [Arcobacter sp. CECT 8986]